tara:strand:+ start:5351 stop:5944 length:594 start_codon:yes stop_codon:yes gene_type:complete
MNTEKLLRQSLNKASESNKDIIVRNLIDIIKDINDIPESDAIISKFIEQLFAKCINEPNFIKLYVDIIYDLFMYIKPIYPNLATKLYKLLINHTQTEYSADITIENRPDKVTCTLFVSELINKGFINIKIANMIIKSLLNTDNQYKHELGCIIVNKVSIKNKISKDHLERLKVLYEIPGTSQRILFKITDTIDIIEN